MHFIICALYLLSTTSPVPPHIIQNTNIKKNICVSIIEGPENRASASKEFMRTLSFYGENCGRDEETGEREPWCMLFFFKDFCIWHSWSPTPLFIGENCAILAVPLHFFMRLVCSCKEKCADLKLTIIYPGSHCLGILQLPCINVGKEG